MWLLIATVLAAALVMFLSRGSFKALTTLRLCGFWLLAAGLLIQAALEYINFSNDEIDTVGYGLLMASYALILSFCIANLGTRGFGLIAIGVAMNVVVIGLNQGMPTRPVGSDAHGNRVFAPVERTVKHRQERSDDLFGFLGDRILFPRPLNELVSIGDLVIAAGVCELVYFASRRSRTAAGAVT